MGCIRPPGKIKVGGYTPHSAHLPTPHLTRVTFLNQMMGVLLKMSHPLKFKCGETKKFARFARRFGILIMLIK